MFNDYFGELGPELVLMGSKRIFIRLEAMPIIEKKFNELVKKKNVVA